jgi:RNA polymerase sigma-70 factor (ECF subfamily)
MEEYSDEELMSLAAGSDIHAFEELFRRYNRRLFAFFYRLLPDIEQAKDCSQDTFLRLWRDRARYARKGSFSTYIFRIAKNHFVDRYRQQKSRINLRPIFPDCSQAGYKKPGLQSDPFNVTVENEIESVIAGAIARLPETHRLVYVLSEEQRLSYREIADILSCPVGTVSSRKVEALKKLRELLRPLRNELLNDGS